MLQLAWYMADFYIYLSFHTRDKHLYFNHCLKKTCSSFEINSNWAENITTFIDPHGCKGALQKWNSTCCQVPQQRGFPFKQPQKNPTNKSNLPSQGTQDCPGLKNNKKWSHRVCFRCWGGVWGWQTSQGFLFICIPCVDGDAAHRIIPPCSGPVSLGEQK